MSEKLRESWETCFNVVNTMMGSALLVMPVKFYNTGILSSLIGALVIFLISYLTCYLCIIHSRDDEFDYPLALRRLLGRKGEVLFNVISMTLFVLVSIIHFILMSNLLYSVVVCFLSDWGEFPGNSEISFSKFSMQWTGIMLSIPCAIMYSFKDISAILKINDKGVYMILTFTVYLIYLGIQSISSEDISFKNFGISGSDREGLDIVLLNADVPEIIGVFSLAFIVHSSAVGIMKKNRDQTKNSRVLLTAYIMVLIKYSLLGIFGSFAFAGMMKHSNLPNKSKLSDVMLFMLEKDNAFFSHAQRIVSIFILLLIFIQLATVLPILNLFARRRFFGLIYGNRDDAEIKSWQSNCFNIGFTLLCLGFEIPVFRPILIISYTGAFGGFFIIYLFPIVSHLKCLYLKKSNDFKSTSQTLTNDELNNINNQLVDCSSGCREDDTHSEVSNRICVIVAYTLLILFGLMVLIANLYRIILS